MPHIVSVRLDSGEIVDDNVVVFIASRSSDQRYSFTGSGMPFTNAEQAFHDTPNKGTATFKGGNLYEISLQTLPNSYYCGLGTHKVPPRVSLRWRSGGVLKGRVVDVGKPIPYRSLTFPPNGKFDRSVSFYDNEYPFARSQERILLESAYPSEEALLGNAPEPRNFWGTRPPV